MGVISLFWNMELTRASAPSDICVVTDAYFCAVPQVQRVAAGIDLGHTLFSALPSLLVAPFWGPWTDKAGRKHGMIVPAVGAMIESAVVLLIMYFRWPLWVMFIGGAINGFSGFLTTITLSVMAYIADTTEKENRAFRLGENSVGAIINNSQSIIIVAFNNSCKW